MRRLELKSFVSICSKPVGAMLALFLFIGPGTPVGSFITLGSISDTLDKLNIPQSAIYSVDFVVHICQKASISGGCDDFHGELCDDFELNSPTSGTVGEIGDTLLEWVHELEWVHDFTGLPMTEDGWTDLSALYRHPALYSDSRIVYVSNSVGNDLTGKVYQSGDSEIENDPFSVMDGILPFATIRAAYSRLRNGHPDILLLKRGDEWTESFAGGGAGRLKSGRNILERSIIASYGKGDRPRLFQSIIDAGDANYTIVTGIHSYDSSWLESERALEIYGSVNHQLYEDMRFDHKSKDKIQGGTPGVSDISNVCIRRCFYSHYQAHDGFIYIELLDGILIEENVFSEPWDDSFPDGSRHGRTLYFNPGEGEDKNRLKNVILRQNIVFRAERGGFDARGGGLIENNLFMSTDGVGVGGNGGSRNSVQSGYHIDNVHMKGSPNTGASNGLHFRGIDGGSIVGNIWTDPRDVRPGEHLTMNLWPMGDQTEFKVLRNILIADNIVYNYQNPLGQGTALRFQSLYSTIENVVVVGNEFQFNNGSGPIVVVADWNEGVGDSFEPFTFANNRYYSTNNSFTPGTNYAAWVSQSSETGSSFAQIKYPDPNRTIDTYMTSLGLRGGDEEFMAWALNQSRTNWNPAFTAAAVNNYIRAGFGR